MENLVSCVASETEFNTFMTYDQPKDADLQDFGDRKLAAAGAIVFSVPHDDRHYTCPNSPALTYRWKNPWSNVLLGEGAYSYVFKATENGTERVVAIKQARSSKKAKRPTLQHETRVLQLLRGHPHIPIVFAYGQLEHFEYMAMEILGPSIADKLEDGAGVLLETVIRVMNQALSALDHIHSFGIIHRDIKAGNILCSLEDPSIIKIIDFGIAKPFYTGTDPELTKYDPLNERRSIVGSLYWASLNSHNGLELSPRDDLESLAFVAFFLLRGNLPWRPRPPLESRLRSQEVVRLLKTACPGPVLFSGFPLEFSAMLDYSRSLAFNQLPDYKSLKSSFESLAKSTELSLQEGALDWTPYHPEINTDLVLCEPEVSIVDEDDEDEEGDGVDQIDFEDSYCEMDLDMWELPGDRDKDVTLPAEQVVGLDDIIASIAEVERVA